METELIVAVLALIFSVLSMSINLFVLCNILRQ